MKAGDEPMLSQEIQVVEAAELYLSDARKRMEQQRRVEYNNRTGERARRLKDILGCLVPTCLVVLYLHWP